MINNIIIIIQLMLVQTAPQEMISAPAKPEAGFSNPVFNGADPWFFQKDGYYYYCYSSGNGISISKSPFLTRKGETKKIWQAPLTGWNRSCVWAPELHFFDGHWYVYYAAGESGPPYIHQKTGVLRSATDDVFSDYTDAGMIYTGDDPGLKNDPVWAIDMTVFKWNGKIYAVWSGWEKPAETDKTSQHLYIAEMSDPVSVRSKRVKISGPEENWETGGPLDLQEGPAILIHGNDLFIIYSCRESWTIDYRLGQLRLKDKGSDPLLVSSWVKSGPVFQGPFGVGHCSFVKSPDGREDWIAYHSKKEASEGWNRDVRLQPFGWKPDGSPDFGKAAETGVIIQRPSGELKLEKKLNGKNPRNAGR